MKVMQNFQIYKWLFTLPLSKEILNFPLLAQYLCCMVFSCLHCISWALLTAFVEFGSRKSANTKKSVHKIVINHHFWSDRITFDLNRLEFYHKIVSAFLPIFWPYILWALTNELYHKIMCNHQFWSDRITIELNSITK